MEKDKAVVMTSQEVCDLVKSGSQSELKDVDVVTTATRAVMSGTYAVFSFPVAHPGSFVRAGRVWMNGIPAFVGPCPNEKLGVLDLIVYGTAHSREKEDYGGGHLFRDIVERKPAIVDVETDDGKTFQAEANLDEMPLPATGSRRPSRTIPALVQWSVSSIFHVEFEPTGRGATSPAVARSTL
jgi:uncharacterized protein (DUF39 family)